MKLSKAYLGDQDERGSIFDIVLDDAIGAVGHVSFTQGAIRGNHIHERTTQWNYVVSGSLSVVVRDANGVLDEFQIQPGDLLKVDPGEAHAFQALSPTHIVVFTMGPRAGKEYESDTYRLEVPLIA